MVKSAKNKKEEKPVQKKSNYDITVKAPEEMTFEELMKMAVTTPRSDLKKNKDKKKQ